MKFGKFIEKTASMLVLVAFGFALVVITSNFILISKDRTQTLFAFSLAAVAFAGLSFSYPKERGGNLSTNIGELFFKSALLLGVGSALSVTLDFGESAVNLYAAWGNLAVLIALILVTILAFTRMAKAVLNSYLLLHRQNREKPQPEKPCSFLKMICELWNF